MDPLKTWVSDNVLSVYGVSDSSTVEFIIETARNSASLPELKSRLGRLELDPNLPFVTALFEKVPKSTSKAKELAHQRRIQEKEVKNTLALNETFSLVEEEVLVKSKPKSKSLRKKIVQDDDDDDTVVVKRKRTYEEEIQEDIKERDELVQRMHQRDIASSESKKETKESKEAKKRIEISKNNDPSVLDSLRLKSRQAYLSKRQDQKLLLLEKEIEDEQLLFTGENLSQREIKDLEYKKEVLRLAKERNNIKDGYDGYMMPDDYVNAKGKLDKKKIDSVLYKRYQDTKEVSDFVTDQAMLEANLLRNVKMDKPMAEEFEFDYVFDDDQQIRFLEEAITQIEEIPVDSKPVLSEAQKKAMEINDVRKSLPIYEFRDELLAAIEEFQGETGSGKTTQIPQYLHEAGYTANKKKVGCTQPRRVAAMSVAARVADEMGTKIGHDVGYSIRFEDCTSEKTVIKFMTDGMLLREFLNEPDISSYSCLMIDEAHERTLHTDILFGLVKDIARFRKDLKLLISSATMDAEKFSRYFDDAPIFNIKGRKFPVTTYYTAAPEADYLAAAITTIMTIHVKEPPGDVLLFLTGQEEIETAEQSLSIIARQLGGRIPEMKICPIYSTMPSEKQAEIFEPTPPGVRKIVIATNIAETSITIDGIVYVIDPGFVKQKSYNPKTGMESLVVVPASRAAANQRKGRAGRVQAGKCFRLYTKWAFNNELDENTIPEIQRTNLGNVVLLLKSLGINDLINFDFMDSPPVDTLKKALEQLYALGALNSNGELTKLGRKMAEFPTDPMLSKTLIAAEEYHCTDEVVSIIAMLSTGNAIFFRPKQEALQSEQARKNFFRAGGDHISMLAIWEAWAETDFSYSWCKENYIQSRSMKRARDIKEQLVGLMERTEVPLLSNLDPGNTIPIRKAFTAGFFYNAARLQRTGDSYRTIKHNQTVMIHPSSSMFIPPNTDKENVKWVLYHELVFTTREFMRQVIEIQPDWLLEVAPHYYKPGELDDDSKKMPKRVGKAPAVHVDVYQ